MSTLQEFRDALIGWTVSEVETYAEEGGLRLCLRKESEEKGMIVYPGAAGGLHFEEDPRSNEEWRDLGAMFSNITLHSCDHDETKIEVCDNVLLRLIGFSCSGCGKIWSIGLTQIRRVDHPWKSALISVRTREMIATRLGGGEVSPEWGSFFRGEGPIPPL